MKTNREVKLSVIGEYSDPVLDMDDVIVFVDAVV